MNVYGSSKVGTEKKPPAKRQRIEENADAAKDIVERSVLCVYPDVSWCIQQAVSQGVDSSPLKFPWLAEAQASPKEGMIPAKWLNGTLHNKWVKSNLPVEKIPVQSVIYWNVTMTAGGKLQSHIRGKISEEMAQYDEQCQAGLKSRTSAAAGGDDSDGENEP